MNELDLSPWRCEYVDCGAYRLRFLTPLELSPTLDDSEQLICLEDEDLAIHLFAPTVEELREALDEEIEALWRHYAEANDAELSPAAQRLKQRLLKRIRREESVCG